MNKEFILRLTKYKRLIHKLKSLGFERVFSNNLGDAIGVTPALVRKDFSTLHLSGNKRGGYNIDMLVEEFDIILGRNTQQNIILVGCGRIGQSLINYPGFISDDIHLVAGFDIDPLTLKNTTAIPVFEMGELESYVKEKEIKVGIIAVPGDEASSVLDKMASSGIRGVLNFAPVELKCQKYDYDCPCVIQNVNIGLELEHLFYQVSTQGTDFTAERVASDEPSDK
ncbi:MAG: redox-sensing transcriptional repressor Rex [Spirochaetales bacterium]|nr:redox-sensing transcriptional repressor Rex [Spirochaetales bacterium]